MEMMLSDPVNIPFTHAAYCPMDLNDSPWSLFFTEAELQEISATVAPIRLRVEDLDEDEKSFLEVMKKLIKQAGRRLTLSGLQDIADNFMSNFRDVIHRQLCGFLRPELSCQLIRIPRGGSGGKRK